MSTQRVKVHYLPRTYATGKIDIVLTFPDGTRATRTMAPDDILVMDLADNAFVSDEALQQTQQTRGEAFYAKAIELAPGADTDDLIRLADFLSEHPERAS